MKKWKRAMLLFVIILSICFGVSGQASASEDTTYDSSTIPKVKITDCFAADYKTIQITIKALEKDDYYYEIYRSGTENGTYQIIDTLDDFGAYWYIGNDGYKGASGEKNKIRCLKNNKEYIFFDSTVKFHKKYYYKIRLRNDMDIVGDYSEVKSAIPALQDTRILKGYADLSGKVKLSWATVKGAQGYQVLRKEGSKWKVTKRIKKGSQTQYTDKKVKSGKTYQYKVCAYRKYNGKNIVGSCANIYKVTVKDANIKGSYTPGSVYGPALSSGELQEVGRAVQGFVNNYVRKGMNDYEKVEMAYKFLNVSCAYAYRGWEYNNANTAWGALIYGEAQCSGYARGFKALCDGMGIPCYYVHANEKSLNPSHQWNQVKVKGKWYILDAQGGFFLVSGKTYQKMTGMQWDKSGLPLCKKDYKK